jgi:hypothetical protein
MAELPDSYRIEKLTIEELRKEAKSKGLNMNIWNMKRSELVELLYPSSQEDNKDNDSGKKHDHPQKSESKNVGI